MAKKKSKKKATKKKAAKKKVAEIDSAVRKEWLAKVKEDVFALESAPEEIKSDREIVLVAVKNSWYAFGHADESVKSDAEILNATVSSFELMMTTDEEDAALEYICGRGDWSSLLNETLYGDYPPEVISMLIKAGADVNNDDDGDHLTPLMLAARASSYPEVISLLVDAGGDVNLRRIQDYAYIKPTALMHAIRPQTLVFNPKYGRRSDWKDAVPNYEVISVFIKAGADVNGTTSDEDHQEETVLMWALECQSSPAVIAALIKAGANVHSTCDSWESPGDVALLRAISPRNDNVCESPLNPEVISLLIDAGADVNVIRDEGATPLIAALCQNWTSVWVDSFTEIISMLIKAGADVNYVVEMAESLLEERGLEAIEINTGSTVLMYALRANTSPAVFSLLLEAGADVHAKSNEFGITEGKTVLEYAAEMDLNPEVEALLASEEG